MLRLAIVGAGVMGANHGRVSRQLRDAQVTYVIDPVPERAQRLADSLGARHSTALEDLVGSADAAVVAVPTAMHRPVAEQLLRQGLHVLVEKPLADDLDDARALVACAATTGRLLQVGHVERFNPAVLELPRFVRDLIHIDIERISPFSARVSDGVILDLMIHDLDIALTLADSPVRDVMAIAQHVTSSVGEDLASALLVFENGVTASLASSRVGQNKIRTIALTQAEDFVAVDLLRQSVTINRVDRAEYLSETGMSYRQTGVIEVPFLEQNGEPLALELASFVTACRNGTRPVVSGEDGLRSLELAHRVVAEAVRTGPSVPLLQNRQS